DACGNVRAERRFERARLLLGKATDRRSSADRGVALRSNFRAGRRNQFRKRLAREKRAGEIDDVGIAEEIVEEWLDGSDRVRTSQLEQNDGDLFRCRHDLDYQT